MRLRIGVDTGGTFTDLVLSHEGGWERCKLLSTPDDPARAVLEGVRALLARVGAGSAEVVHGSTVATNALLEGKGGRAAFVTTRGFGDTLHIGRQRRPSLYALEPRRAAAPIPRALCLEVDGRLGPQGEELAPLDEGALPALAQRLRALGVEAVAVSLLHSYANPAHERAVVGALRSALPGVHLTASHELLPELREYERGATCAANAVVAPKMGAYVGRLGAELGALRIMGSDGGTLPAEEVLRAPVYTVLSGPAGGVVGALASAREALGEAAPKLMSFDMGGTSTDVALCEGQPSRTTEGSVGPLPIRVPLVDIHTVGAGGGSVAWVDAGGALRVGPQSCGASPGPACYGGQRAPWMPSVTDAHVVLGRLPPERFLGGAMRLDKAAACAALDALGAALGLGREEAALGVLRVVEATMARALKVISVARGHDPRDFALVCFGGAGGLHACRLAQELGMARVVLPLAPGLLSARGMLDAPASVARSRALLRRLEGDELSLRPLVSWPPVAQALEALEASALAQLAAEGLDPREARVSRALDLRYAGQSHELTISLDEGDGDALGAYAQQHRRLYGYDIPGRAVEVVAARVRAQVAPPACAQERLEARPPGESPPSSRVRAWFDEREEEGLLVERADLRAGDVLDGPLLLTEYSATTVVPSGWRLRATELGHLVLTCAEGPR